MKFAHQFAKSIIFTW